MQFQFFIFHFQFFFIIDGLDFSLATTLLKRFFDGFFLGVLLAKQAQ